MLTKIQLLSSEDANGESTKSADDSGDQTKVVENPIKLLVSKEKLQKQIDFADKILESIDMINLIAELNALKTDGKKLLHSPTSIKRFVLFYLYILLNVFSFS